MVVMALRVDYLAIALDLALFVCVCVCVWGGGGGGGGLLFTRRLKSPRIDRVNEEKRILITTQLVHTTCNSKVSKQHQIVSLTLADDKMAGGCNPESF